MLPLDIPQRNYIQGFWSLDETSGTRYDRSNNGNNLTDNNTVLYAAGKIGKAADFESDNSEYLSITDAAQTGLDITGEITIALWFKLETLGITKSFVSKYLTTGDKRCYKLVFNDADNKIYFFVSPDGVGASSAITASTFSVGTWYHVVATLNQTTDEMQIYINGSADGSAVSFTSNISDKDAAFCIGSADNGAAEYMDGLIDEVIVWNKCLTADEIRQIYEKTAYQYIMHGAGIGSPMIFFKEAWEKHDKLWKPKLAIPKLGYQI